MTASQYLITFLMRLVVILEDVTLCTLYNEMHRCLDNVHNSVHQHFPNDHCMITRMKMHNKPMNTFVTENKMFIALTSDSRLQLSLVRFWYIIKKYLRIYEKATKIFLRFPIPYLCEASFTYTSAKIA